MAKEDSGGEIRFSASTQLYDYLGWLAMNTTLGKTENEVAKQLLTETLSKMRGESYKDRA